MNYRPGSKVPASGIYWCTVCKLPARLNEGQDFPSCKNMCSRGLWEPVEVSPGGQTPAGA